MRTLTLLTLGLLGLLLWSSCVHANNASKEEEAPGDAPAEDDPEEEEDDEVEEPQKEKTMEIEEEHGVMVLHINNFARALEENKYLLVEFCKSPPQQRQN